MTDETHYITEQEAIEAAGRIFATVEAACARMTPREQAEAAWSPTSRLTVDELEDRIRGRRGLPPLERKRGDAGEDRHGDGA